MIPKRKLGRQGLEVSAIGLGCMELCAFDEGSARIKASGDRYAPQQQRLIDREEER